MGTLRKLVAFLGTYIPPSLSRLLPVFLPLLAYHHTRTPLLIQTTAYTIQYNPIYTGLAAPDPSRLGCADVLADRPDTHRTAGAKDIGAAVITKEEVYTPEIACMMWMIFGGRAKKLGYTLPKWVTKEECRTVKYDWGQLLPPRMARVKRRQAALAAQQEEEKAEKAKAAAAAAAKDKGEGLGKEAVAAVAEKKR